MGAPAVARQEQVKVEVKVKGVPTVFHLNLNLPIMFTTFEDMPVWKLVMEIAKEIFKLTEDLPRKEDYGLTSQLRRASLSISANIAEGFGRMHSKDKVKFYYNARGSMSETKNCLIYGIEVGYFERDNVNEVFEKINDAWKQLNCLISSVLSGRPPQPQP